MNQRLPNRFFALDCFWGESNLTTYCITCLNYFCYGGKRENKMSRHRKPPRSYRFRIVMPTILCAILGSLAGYGLGTWYGGTYAQTFTLGSLHGPQAVGVIGLVVGVLWGGLLGWFIGWGSVKLKP
jgi:hypothetical protein